MTQDLGPFHSRPAEWELFQPLIGNSLLELGNKRNGPLTYKAFFVALGYRHISIDLNGLDGALPLDLTKPLGFGTFDMVSNIGTTEHVQQPAPVWRNICEAMHVGSVLVSTTPLPGEWKWHGDYYPTREFYEQLAALNSLTVDRLYVSGETPRRMIFTRMTRTADVPFQMPVGGIYRNVRG